GSVGRCRARTSGSPDLYPKGTASIVKELSEWIILPDNRIESEAIEQIVSTVMASCAGSCPAARAAFFLITASTKRRYLLLEFRKRHFPIWSLGESSLASIDCSQGKASEKCHHPECEQ